LPVSNVSTFVGRTDDLISVETLLTQNQQVNIAAAVGMGGVGKTELALQFAQRRGDRFPGGVCWLRGVEPIASQIIQFAKDCLNLEVPEQTEDPVRWCCQRWPGEGAVLMVVDDVQDYGALKPLLPSASRFRVLLTTRQAILPRSQRLSLEVLVLGAALELLRSLVGPGRIDAEPAEAKALCEWVGRLPLGIELVGWHLEQRPGLTISKLLERLEGKRLAAQALVETHPEMTATLGVAAAFELSWEPLSAGAKRLAGGLGLFAAAPLEWDWMENALRLGLGELEEEALEGAQAELLRVHLLRVNRLEDQVLYQVHPLVREFFAVKLGGLAEMEGLQRGFAEAIVAIAKTIPPTVTVADRSRVTGAIPHLEEVAARWTEVLADDDKTWCCTGLAWFYESLSLWSEAERCHQRALAISEQQLGPDHPSTATSLNNLAELYRSQGRYGEAEPLYLRSLAISEQQLGPDHPITAKSLNNLAGLYKSQGRYGEAEPLLLRSLAIREQQLGPDHPSTAKNLIGLAFLYQSQGRYREAEPLLLRSLAISEQQLGPDHPITAKSLNNLAGLYKSQGRYGEAEPLYVRSLAIKEQQLGPDHPSTATSLNNLAGLYQSQGRYPEAEPLYIQALEIRKTELGDRHPNTAVSLNNLAALYEFQGRYPEAETLYSQALEICKTELGDRHPSTATSLNSLAMLYKAQGRYPEAEPLLILALKIWKAELGDSQRDGQAEHHPDTASGLNNLAALYESQGRYPEAEPLYIQALEIHKTELGDHHPSTATGLNNLALLYYATDRLPESAEMMSDVVSIFEELLGPNHPNTLTVKKNLEIIQQKLNS
jgi:tetratricopeptide (TPR) repeat protein